MCLAIPGRVIKIEDNTGMVEIMGASREISTEFIKDVKVGDYVLVHAGCAIQKIDEEEALSTLQLFKELKELANDR